MVPRRLLKYPAPAARVRVAILKASSVKYAMEVKTIRAINAATARLHGGSQMPEEQYYIFNYEHHAWRLADRSGFTKDIRQAGVYAHDQAKLICEQANRSGQIREEMRPRSRYLVEGSE